MTRRTLGRRRSSSWRCLHHHRLMAPRQAPLPQTSTGAIGPRFRGVLVCRWGTLPWKRERKPPFAFFSHTYVFAVPTTTYSARGGSPSPCPPLSPSYASLPPPPVSPGKDRRRRLGGWPWWPRWMKTASSQTWEDLKNPRHQTPTKTSISRYLSFAPLAFSARSRLSVWFSSLRRNRHGYWLAAC